MAARKRTSKTKKRENVWGPRCAVAGRAILRALPMLLLAGGALYGAVVMWRYAMNDPRFRIDPRSSELTSLGSIGPDAADALKRLGRRALLREDDNGQWQYRSILEPSLLASVRAQYERSPWVRRVCRVRRVFPNRVSIEFILRRAFAQVKTSVPNHPGENRYWVVDDEGVLLPVPGRFEPHPDLPAIVGTTVQSIRGRPAAGETWNDPSVAEAVGVLNELRASPLSEELPVRRLLVHRGSWRSRLGRTRERRPRFDLETRQGVLVRWGTYNHGELPDEMRSREKLTLLRNLVEQYDVLHPGVCLDVRTRVAGFGRIGAGNL